MIRALIAMVTMGWMAMPVMSQQVVGIAQQVAAVTPSKPLDFVPRDQQLQMIAQYEAVAQHAEAVHYTDKDLVNVYTGLGGLYYDVGMFPKSEDTTLRAIALLRQYGPQDQLATELCRLANLHIVMGKVREAEHEHLEALKIREAVGDPLGTALTWSDLAAFYLHEDQYKKAVDYARRAFPVITGNPQAPVVQQISIRQILGSALCESHDPVHGIPMLKDAVAAARDTYGANSMSVAIGSYVLGYAYWHSGDMIDAATWMERGTTGMKSGLGWGHPAYVNAMNNYVKFLRSRGQMEAAATAEREVKLANSVVDARSMTARSSAFAGGPPH